MPVTSRQTPPQPPKPVFPTGSLIATAIPVTELREQHVKVCIYGRNRSGKTTLASMFKKRLLFITCEPAHCGGVQSVSNVEGVTLFPPDNRPATPEEVEKIGKELTKTDYYKTVVLKTVTSLQEGVSDDIKREMPNAPWSGRGSKDTYQLRSKKLHDAMRPILDLTHMDVVILAQEKDHNPPSDDKGFPDLRAKLLQTMQQGSFMAPALGAANAQWLQDACGYIIQIYEDETTQEIVVPQHDPAGNPLPPVIQRVGTGRRQRHLRLLYHPNFAAGGKWQYDPNMPEFVTAPTPAGLFAAMAKYIPSLRA